MNRKLVLIVDDEKAIVDTIQYALKTDGFETICQFSGLPVLPLLSKEKIDLIILDIGLPDINGLELCKQIRASFNVPIIFLTARKDEIDRIVGLEIGGDDYMVKPFSPRELSARVKAILRRTQAVPENYKETESISSSSPFFIDEDRYQISYFGEILKLSKYEFNMLKTFVENPGKIYSRERLMDIVWDEPEMSMERTVDAHIKNLRNKLKQIKPDLDPIQTHRSIGYSLKEVV